MKVDLENGSEGEGDWLFEPSGPQGPMPYRQLQEGRGCTDGGGGGNG